MLALAHTAFVVARPDLRTALPFTIASLVLLAVGGLLALRLSPWSIAAVGASLLLVVAMGRTGGEVDPFYRGGVVLLLAIALAAWGLGRTGTR